MSYTRFSYSRVRANRKRAAANATVRVSFRVTNSGRRAGATVAQLYASPPRVAGVTLPRQRLVGFARTRVLKPGKSQSIAVSVPLASALRQWSAKLGHEVVYRGTWRFRLGRSSRAIVRSLPVQITGSIPRTIATLALAPPRVSLASGDTLDLRGRNPWLDGLAPAQYQREGDSIVSAVRRDDSFVDLAGAPLSFSSDRPDVLRVDPGGVVKAVSPGVATVTVKLGKLSATAPFVVR